MFFVLFMLLLFFGPFGLVLIGAATVSALLTYGLPIVGVLLLIWLICAVISR
ncbi:hypothetical protein [Amycolatopsis sp.]|uniref:hypothetical protein n=1 Tax=Amycolatopsis sp. TaxID=37632 RepID=UPI002BE353CC|nr:hypothetical protein [Amycolatopsis sp.]HVV12459.1 hypothetical protein [Amycolatopsis sp.]